MIEIDGMTWDIINPLIKKRKLPNIERLIQQGSHGILKSLDATLSPVIWTSIVSGKSPDKHGVNHFTVSSNSVRCKRLWDIFTESGLRCGIFSHLVTWPPPRLDCFSIPCFLAQTPETFPPELGFIKKLAIDEKSGSKRSLSMYLNYLKYSLRYGMTPATSFQTIKYIIMKMMKRYNYLDDYYYKRLVAAELNSDIFAYLYKTTEPDFAIFYTNLIDACSHQFWKFNEPELFDDVSVEEARKYEHVIPAVYCKVDGIIGRLLRHVDDDTTVIVLSDHGFQATSRSEKNPLCIIQSSKLIDFMQLGDKVTSTKLAQMIYIHVKRAHKASQDRIMEMFRKVMISESGTSLLDVHKDDYGNIILRPSGEAYAKLQVKSLKGKTVVFNGSSMKFEELVIEGDTKISGVHHVDGVLIMKGPHVRESNHISGAHVYDITPTLLALQGNGVARDMDGKVLTDVIKKDFLLDNPISYIDSYEPAGSETEQTDDDVEENDEVRERLRELGYID
jgi:hypothetical protein